MRDRPATYAAICFSRKTRDLVLIHRKEYCRLDAVLLFYREDKELEEVRLNKYLSEAGVCSRREADRMIQQGLVTVNGRKAVTGERISQEDRVEVNGRPVEKQTSRVLLALYKPEGIVCTAQKREKNNVIDYISYPQRVFPVGRLDKDSTGLLLLTNDGDLVNKIMRAGNYHEKEYLVQVDRPITEEFLRRMRSGVPILDTVTRPCTVERTGKNSFRIILTQGLNRQIRRMCQALGFQVTSLLRVRIMNIRLDGMKKGQLRQVTGEELAQLLELLKDSSSLSWAQQREKGKSERR